MPEQPASGIIFRNMGVDSAPPDCDSEEEKLDSRGLVNSAMWPSLPAPQPDTDGNAAIGEDVERVSRGTDTPHPEEPSASMPDPDPSPNAGSADSSVDQQAAGFSRPPPSLFSNHEYTAAYDNAGKFLGIYDAKGGQSAMSQDDSTSKVKLNSEDDIRKLIVDQKLNAIVEAPNAPQCFAANSDGEQQRRVDQLSGGRHAVGQGVFDSRLDVYVGGELKGSFDSNSLPSDSARFATIQPGYYLANHHMHGHGGNRYDALQLVSPNADADGKITMASEAVNSADAANVSIPTIGRNPAHPNQSFATGINIHRAGRQDQTGMLGNTAISEGCQLVPTSQWQDFINIIGSKDKNGNYLVPHFDTWVIRRNDGDT